MPSARQFMIVGIVAALTAGMVAIGPAASPAQAATGSRMISGWFGWWATTSQVSSVASRGGSVTEEAMQFMWAFNGPDDPVCLMNPEAGGSCITGSTTSRYRTNRDALRAKGIKVYATHTDLNANRKGQLSAYLATAANRQALADLLTARAVAAGVDGVDLDWESFAFHDGSSTWAATKPRFVDFVARASASLHRAGKSLSVTTPAGYSPFRNGAPNDSGGYWVFSWKEIIPHVDRLRLMAYDYSVGQEGPVGPNNWAEEVVRSALAQVGSANAHKISLGVHQYGRDWVRKNASGQYLATNCPSTWRPDSPTTSRTLAAVRSISASKRVEPTWHSTYKEWFLDYSEAIAGTYDNAGTRTAMTCTAQRRIWFGDQRTAQERLRLVGKYRLAGIAAWNLGGIEGNFYSAGLSALALSIANDTRLPAGTPLEVAVAGREGVPAQASAVAVNVTVVDPAEPGYLQVYPCGSPAPPTSTANFTSGQTVAATTIAKLGTGGKVCVRATASAHLLVDIAGYFPAATDFAPRPQRLLDTRTTGPAAGPGTIKRVTVPGGARTAALTITATGSQQAGWVAAYACGAPTPTTSTVNFAAGQATANLHVGAVGSNGQVCLTASTGTDIVVDLVGTFPAGSDMVPRTASRLKDTRTASPLAPGVPVAVPVPNAATAVLNLTAVAPPAGGHITAYPCGRPVPSTSSLNFAPGQTVANAALVEVGDNGSVCLVSSTQAHALVDIAAAVPSRPDFRAQAPKRLLDTREPSAPNPVGGVVSVVVPDKAAAAEVTLTVTSPVASGYATVYPCGSPVPPTSNVNFRAGQTVANSTIVAVGTGNRVCAYTSARADVVVDYLGYVPPGSDYDAHPPKRLLDTRSGSVVQPNGVREVAVPAQASAAVLNLTAVGPKGAGFLSVGACGSVPPTSDLNYAAGDVVANLAITAPGPNGRVCVRSTAQTHIVVDLMGSFRTGADISAAAGQRLLDTRQRGGAPAAFTVHSVPVPKPGTAAAINVTVTEPTGFGWVQAWPCGSPIPPTSTANFSPGQTVAASVLVQIGQNQRVCVRASTQTHLVIDHKGTQRPITYDSSAQVRLADTRT